MAQEQLSSGQLSRRKHIFTSTLLARGFIAARIGGSLHGVWQDTRGPDPNGIKDRMARWKPVDPSETEWIARAAERWGHYPDERVASARRAEDGNWEVDIANLNIEELPTAQRAANLIAAQRLIQHIFDVRFSQRRVANLAPKVHVDWAQENWEWADRELLTDYYALTDTEQEKDRVIAQSGVDTANSFFRSIGVAALFRGKKQDAALNNNPRSVFWVSQAQRLHVTYRDEASTDQMAVATFVEEELVLAIAGAFHDTWRNYIRDVMHETHNWRPTMDASGMSDSRLDHAFNIEGAVVQVDLLALDFDDLPSDFQEDNIRLAREFLARTISQYTLNVDLPADYRTAFAREIHNGGRATRVALDMPIRPEFHTDYERLPGWKREEIKLMADAGIATFEAFLAHIANFRVGFVPLVANPGQYLRQSVDLANTVFLDAELDLARDPAL